MFLSVCSAEGPNPCELAQNPRYRKGPDVCFDNNENVRHKHVILSKNVAESCSVSVDSCQSLPDFQHLPLAQVQCILCVFVLYLYVIGDPCLWFILSCFSLSHHLSIFIFHFFFSFCMLRMSRCVRPARVLHPTSQLFCSFCFWLQGQSHSTAYDLLLKPDRNHTITNW